MLLNCIQTCLRLQDFDPMADHRVARITDREGEYQARRRAQRISPERHDPFAG
jgi:hypothetical protein